MQFYDLGAKFALSFWGISYEMNDEVMETVTNATEKIYYYWYISILIY